MIEGIVNRIVKMMIEEQVIEESDQEDYQYSLHCMTESFITVGSILIISCILKNIIATSGFLLFFLALRKRTGGYHASTFGHCYWMTLVTYGFVVYLCQNIRFWQKYHWLGVFISSMIILVIGTVNHPDVHMTQSELKNAKEAARWMLMLEIGVLFFLKWMNASPIMITYLSTAIALCGILLFFAKLIRQEVKTDE
ncbi:MAG: accessory gene regulator B family protein [Lachnospiraceae bacterium]|nr:accessory gene regulator B family protein [Lachnospiraceae bacterium]